MKKTIQTLVTVAIFGALSLSARAQPAVKLQVVDMAKLYDSHYRTIENNAKLQSDDQKAQEEVGKMNKEGQDLVDQYKALNDKSSNPALTADAKASAQNEAQKVFEAIQNKQREVQAFIQNTRNALQQRMQTYKALILEEISKAATEVAKRKGATLLVDKSGPSLFQIPTVIYADTGFDITDEVMKEINKDRPPTAMQGPATTPAAAAAPAAAPATGSSAVNLPGLTPTPKKN